MNKNEWTENRRTLFRESVRFAAFQLHWKKFKKAGGFSVFSICGYLIVNLNIYHSYFVFLLCLKAPIKDLQDAFYYQKISTFQKRKFYLTPMQDLVPWSKEKMLLFFWCLSASRVECTCSVITSCKSPPGLVVSYLTCQVVAVCEKVFLWKVAQQLNYYPNEDAPCWFISCDGAWWVGVRPRLRHW